MKALIISFIKDFVKNYKTKDNSISYWNEPLIAFASATDPMFWKLKEVVGPDHKLPTDWLKNAKTIICYFIPFEKEIVLSNEGGEISSEQWAIAYIETNRLITDLNKHLSNRLGKLGSRSAPLPPTHNFDTNALVSDWSHKHAAFIAGLGRFGLHHMLITEKGCCGRLGSLITDIEIEPTKRSQEEFCLYKRNKSCKKCVENCIFGALKPTSFDRKNATQFAFPMLNSTQG